MQFNVTCKALAMTVRRDFYWVETLTHSYFFFFGCTLTGSTAFFSPLSSILTNSTSKIRVEKGLIAGVGELPL